MLLGIKLKNDVTIECEGVLKDSARRCLLLHTKAITPIKAYQILADQNATSVIVAIKNDQPIKIYNGYTDLFGVQKSDLTNDPNEILIILKRPEPIDEDTDPN